MCIYRIALGLTLALFAGCAAKHDFRKVEKVDFPNHEGVYFSLPQTVINVTVPVSQTTVSRTFKDLPNPLPPGIETDDYIDTSKNIGATYDDENSNSQFIPDKFFFENGIATIGDIAPALGIPADYSGKPTFGVPVVSTYSESNPDMRFVAKFDDALDLTDSELSAELTANGLIVNGSSTRTDRKLETAVKVIDVTAQIAARAANTAITGGAGVGAPLSIEAEIVTDGASRKVAKFVIQDNRKPYGDLNSKELQYVLIARSILLNNLSIQKVLEKNLGDDDGAAVELKLKTLMEQRNEAYSKLFSSHTMLWNASLSFLPKRPNIQKDPVAWSLKDKPLMKLKSGNNGTKDVFHLELGSGDSLFELRRTPKVPSVLNNPAATAEYASIKYSITAIQPINPRPKDITDQDQFGYPYQIPQDIQFTVYSEQKGDLTSQIISVSQLGSWAALPSSIGAVSSYQMAYFPETGALKTANISSTAPDVAGSAESIGGSIGTIQDALAAREAAKAEEAAASTVTPPTTLEALQQRRDELSVDLEIRQLEAEIAAGNFLSDED